MGGRRGEATLPFLENWIKCPDFGKYALTLFIYVWVKFPIKNAILRVSRKKENTKFFPHAGAFFHSFMYCGWNVYRSTLLQETSPALQQNSWFRPCNACQNYGLRPIHVSLVELTKRRYLENYNRQQDIRDFDIIIDDKNRWQTAAV